MKVEPLEWIVEPAELPLRLVLYRIIEAASGPIHVLEIEKILADLGIEYEDKVLQNRLSELTKGPSSDMMIRRVQAGIFTKIGE